MSLHSAPVDVYLFPAVVGGGLGDIDEVLCAGHYLSRMGSDITLYRRPSHPLPPMVDGPWNWPRHHRTDQLKSRADRALTISPAWGVSCAPRREGPLGRPGPWSEETSDIEGQYGSDRTIHVSLEEFARTLTSREENLERYREGGRAAREIRAFQRSQRFASEVREYHEAFRKFRALDRTNVIHLFASFQYAAAFQREYPEAVQTGPLWPVGLRRARPIQRPHEPSTASRWLWYASPSSSSAIVPAIAAGFARSRALPRMIVRSPHAETFRKDLPAGWQVVPPERAARWRRRIRTADVWVVTGSRSLLEAIQLGRPWLYFNGVLGNGPHRRSHRPEKLRALLRVWPSGPGSHRLRRDLRDFSRGRRIPAIVASFVDGNVPRHDAYVTAPRPPLLPPRGDAGGYVQDVARRWAMADTTAADFVQAERSFSGV
ncbi:MAG: hypothetical protein WCA77_02395 [Thermoplasmata archaeon]